MRSHGSYADLTLCIDRISSQQLDLLYDACTALSTPRIAFTTYQSHYNVATKAESQAKVRKAWREKTRPPSAARLHQELETPNKGDLSLADCAAVLVSASGVGVRQLAELFERLAPNLLGHFTDDQIAELERTIGLTFEVYS